MRPTRVKECRNTVRWHTYKREREANRCLDRWRYIAEIVNCSLSESREDPLIQGAVRGNCKYLNVCLLKRRRPKGKANWALSGHCTCKLAEEIMSRFDCDSPRGDERRATGKAKLFLPRVIPSCAKCIVNKPAWIYFANAPVIARLMQWYWITQWLLNTTREACRSWLPCSQFNKGRRLACISSGDR